MRNIDNITKTLRRPFAGAALCALALAGALSVTGCRKQGIPASKGDNVLFSAGVGGSESGTKTAYTNSNASDRSLAENINWLSGDQIRIWCAECSEPTKDTYGNADHFADYTVTPTDGTPNKATIAVNPGTVGLRWGEAGTQHNFYAVYPSPKTTDKGSDTGTFGTDPVFTFTGHIPATQAVSGVTTNGNTTIASPDMTNLYMVSKAQATPESDGTGVFLRFTPLSTAIQFTISKDSENEDEVLYVALESAEHKISGAFNANISEWTPAESGSYVYPACTLVNSGDNRVEINMGGQGITVSNSKYLTFTFFLLPTSDVDDLSFIIKKKDKDNTVTTLKTKLSMADGSKITFPTHKKTYVKGILIPDGLVTLSVTTTDYDLEPPTDPTTVGETVNYNEQGSTDPTTGGSTGDYGSEGSTDPTTGGSTGNYNEQGSTDPTTGGSTGDYGSENPTDPTTGGSTGNYNENNDINIFQKPQLGNEIWYKTADGNPLTFQYIFDASDNDISSTQQNDKTGEWLVARFSADIKILGGGNYLKNIVNSPYYKKITSLKVSPTTTNLTASCFYDFYFSYLYLPQSVTTCGQFWYGNTAELTIETPSGIFVVKGNTGYQSITLGNGTVVTWNTNCFVKGTPITLADGTTKPVEDLTYEDDLLVWNFDEGHYDSAKLLWITAHGLMADHYYKVTFSDGTILKLCGPGHYHKLFNYTDKVFEYANDIEEGKEVYTEAGIVTIVSRERIEEEVEYYNLITKKHINCFAEGVLAASHFNNVYPINQDMKFVKDGRKIRPWSEFRKEFKKAGIGKDWYEGVRLYEQPDSLDDVVDRLAKKEAIRQPRPEQPGFFARIWNWIKGMFSK